MLVAEWLPVCGVQRDVLGSTLEGGAEVEQLAVGTPASTLLGFSSEIPQERNSFLTEGLGIFRGIDQYIHQTIQALGAEDGEGFAELLKRTDAPAKEMAIGQLHHAAVNETIVELLAVFLAAAKGADEFTHRDLALHHLADLACTGGLGIPLGDVTFEHLPVGGADDFRFLRTR